MLSSRWVGALGLFCLLAQAEESSPDADKPESLLLARIRSHMAETLNRLPNYTCLETIDRAHRRGWSQSVLRPVDRLRLEVAYVNGREMFSWPGAGRFDERELTDIVGGGGAIGNGDFALFARSVFLSDAATFQYVGEEHEAGQRLYRYDYEVPREKSGYTVRVRPYEGIVGYRGSFWVDAATLDLRRLHLHSHQVPPQLPLRTIRNTLEYARVPIGAASFLLPHRSSLSLVDLDGGENVNTTSFSRCRQYTGESVLRFDDAEPEPVQAVTAEELAQLPAGIAIEAELLGGPGPWAIGDPVLATLRHDVRQGRGKNARVLLPQKAVLQGRIIGMRHYDSPVELSSWQVQFGEVALGSLRAPLQGVIEAVGPSMEAFSAVSGPSLGMPHGSALFRQVQRHASKEPPGAMTFYVRGNTAKLPARLRIVFRTTGPAHARKDDK